ncbi:serine hydrolase domain-containing protein [Psychroflexus sp. ALD_RP9]|uniref:serine hydrolase domain-containing protein n=1 Tax=Psychroflexus sp. ALD_RP9 TaxID=2777186 RepID=UPI001A90AF65|nr:serine hydrolase domain-containing protein [Psychroflexus sp. ALD_RP9]QSS98259.1 beta-lactamase family protein [Psychroflexus sp. ALD_RP9]
MLKNKRRILLLIAFMLIVAVFINYSFSHATAHKTAKEASKLVYDEVIPDKKPKFDYKLILADRLLNFEKKLNYKAKRSRFNGVVLVAYKNQVIFEKAYGYADPTSEDLLTTDISFELASVSKQFTAAAVLKLAELGKVDINQALVKYFPEFKFENIKVRDLLKHSSGLWDYMNLTEAYWNQDKAPNHFEVLELINQHQNSLSFRPGSRFDYNNTNYAILVALTEKLSGLSFRDFLQQHFFSPYCIDETYVGVDNRLRENVITAFQPYGRTYIDLPPSFHNGALGDKGIHTTANNLWLWFKHLKNYELLSKASVHQMFNLDTFKQYDYGMGFRTRVSANGELEIYHDGLWDGFRNGLHYFPKDELTYIVLSHTQNRSKVYFQNYLEKQAKKMLNNLKLNKLSKNDSAKQKFNNG